jgi:hypothetical protein
VTRCVSLASSLANWRIGALRLLSPVGRRRKEIAQVFALCVFDFQLLAQHGDRATFGAGHYGKVRLNCALSLAIHINQRRLLNLNPARPVPRVPSVIGLALGVRTACHLCPFRSVWESLPARHPPSRLPSTRPPGSGPQPGARSIAHRNARTGTGAPGSGLLGSPGSTAGGMAPRNQARTVSNPRILDHPGAGVPRRRHALSLAPARIATRPATRHACHAACSCAAGPSPSAPSSLSINGGPGGFLLFAPAAGRWAAAPPTTPRRRRVRPVCGPP